MRMPGGVGALLGLLLFCGVLSLPALAETPIQDEAQAWQIVILRGHLTRRFLGYLDAQNHVANLTDKPGRSVQHAYESQLMLRSALGVQLTDRLTYWQGFGWMPSFQPQFRNEYQAWEQLLYERRFKYFSVTSRTRLESRYIENTGSGASHRVWSQLRVGVPLGRNSRWSLVVFDQPFYNLNSVPNGPRHGFNQNWAFVGVGRRLTKTLSLDAGYLNNYVRNYRPVPNRMNHVFFVSVVYNLGNAGVDLRKPKQPDHQPKAYDESVDTRSRLKLADFSPETATAEKPNALGAGLSACTQPEFEITPVGFSDEIKHELSEAPVLLMATKTPGSH